MTAAALGVGLWEGEKEGGRGRVAELTRTVLSLASVTVTVYLSPLSSLAYRLQFLQATTTLVLCHPVRIVVMCHRIKCELDTNLGLLRT